MSDRLFRRCEVMRICRLPWHTLSAVAGIVALVWVAYLAGRIGARRDCAEANLERSDHKALERPSLDSPPPAEAPGASAWPDQPVVKPPEVWTRMAGLNVWIAGKRQQVGDTQLRIVVILHGYGRPREKLLNLAEHEAVRYGTTFVFPEAGLALDWRRRAWWQPRKSKPGGPAAKKLPEELPAAREQILTLLGEVREKFSVTNSEIVLCGVSQGGTLAFDAAVHSEKPLGGLAVLSGKLTGQQEWHPLLPRLRAVPVFLSHGRADPIAPFGAADRLRKALLAAEADVTWVPYDAGHEIAGTAQREFSRFIKRAINPPYPPTRTDTGPSHKTGVAAAGP